MQGYPQGKDRVVESTWLITLMKNRPKVLYYIYIHVRLLNCLEHGSLCNDPKCFSISYYYNPTSSFLPSFLSSHSLRKDSGLTIESTIGKWMVRVEYFWCWNHPNSCFFCFSILYFSFSILRSPYQFWEMGNGRKYVGQRWVPQLPILIYACTCIYMYCDLNNYHYYLRVQKCFFSFLVYYFFAMISYVYVLMRDE